MCLWGEKVEGEKCISAQGSSVKGSSQQSFTSGPKVKGGAYYFQAGAQLLWVGKWYYTSVEHQSDPLWNLGTSFDTRTRGLLIFRASLNTWALR